MIDFFQATLAFILVLGPLVFIHEFGHFIVAKAFGIDVPVFSLGFGPRLFGLERGGTDYRVSLIPLGGYVRLAGDEADENRTGAANEFLSRPRWQRFLVFVAGAAFNIALAFLAFWLLFAVYGKEQVPEGYPVVRVVDEGSPAELAGVRAGDRIVSIAGRDVGDAESFLDAYNLEVLLAPNSDKEVVLERGGARVPIRLNTGVDPKLGLGSPGWHPVVGGGEEPVIRTVMRGGAADAAGVRPGDRIVGIGSRRPVTQIESQLLIAASPDRELELTVARDGGEVRLTVVPRPEGERGVIGVIFEPPVFERRRLSFGEAAAESVRTNLHLSRTLFVVLKRLVTTEVSIKTMSGPIGIARFAKQALISGPDAFLNLLGFFSLQLGILNLLPIPVLDGGHILILGIEGTLRRELSERIKERVMQLGFVFLLAFMGLIVVLDVLKL